MAAAPEPGEPEKKPFKLLGILDVENTPCARESVLYGSLGFFAAGLGHFLATSSIVGIILLSKESRKELPEKELKIRFYMKAPTLILKEKSRTAATEPLTSPWESTANVYIIQ